MIRKKIMTRSWLVALVLALLLVSAVTIAAAGGGYTLNWWTVDGGGGSAAGGSFALEGTAGQADAGLLDGGDYTLKGGYWSAPAAPPPPDPEFDVYLPLVLGQ